MAIALLGTPAACAQAGDASVMEADAGKEAAKDSALDTASDTASDKARDTAGDVDLDVEPDSIFPVDEAGGMPCTKASSCTTTCGTTGRRECKDGVTGPCVPPAEICNGIDDDCNGKIDELDCSHKVECRIFDDGYASLSGLGDAIFVNATGASCIPDATTGTCRRWMGRCHAKAAADGHEHEVTFAVFEDGYASITAGSDAVLVDATHRACVSGGPTGECRKWFGRAHTNVVQGHSHSVECFVFDDGYASIFGPTDAVYFNGTTLCAPGGATGTCRKWFGRCVTK